MLNPKPVIKARDTLTTSLDVGALCDLLGALVQDFLYYRGPYKQNKVLQGPYKGSTILIGSIESIV